MTEIQMTDRIGDLDIEQFVHFVCGLENAHEMTLHDAGLGRYWLTRLEDDGALLLSAERTVEHVWRCAEAISATAER